MLVSFDMVLWISWISALPTVIAMCHSPAVYEMNRTKTFLIKLYLLGCKSV
jgi:hypothetical protein